MFSTPTPFGFSFLLRFFFAFFSFSIKSMNAGIRASFLRALLALFFLFAALCFRDAHNAAASRACIRMRQGFFTCFFGFKCGGKPRKSVIWLFEDIIYFTVHYIHKDKAQLLKRYQNRCIITIFYFCFQIRNKRYSQKLENTHAAQVNIIANA